MIIAFIGILLITLICSIVFQIIPFLFFKYTICRKKPLANSRKWQMVQQSLLSEAYWIDMVDKQNVEIESFDGLKLRGYFLKHDKDSPYTMIFLHGYSGEAHQWSSLAEYVYNNYHYNVLLPHLRAHGSSEGNYIGFGGLESRDCLGWIKYVIENISGEKSKIILFGSSMGASTILLTLASDDLPSQVIGGIEDCGYTSAKDEIMYQMQVRFHIRSEWLFNRINKLTIQKAKYNLNDISVVDRIEKVKTPLLFIHGMNDTFTPFSMVHDLYNAARVPKLLFTVKGADHSKSFNVDTDGYKSVMENFILEHLVHDDQQLEETKMKKDRDVSPKVERE